MFSNSLLGESLLITDSFSLQLNKRLQNNQNTPTYSKSSKFKYDHYFTWILKNLLNRKLYSNTPQEGEWAFYVSQEKSLPLPTQLSLMSSSLDDFEHLAKNLSNQKKKFDNAVVYLPLLDLCHVVENFNASTKNYVKWKFEEFLEPAQKNIPSVKVIHSNNVLSWMGMRDAKKKLATCMAKDVNDLMIKLTFCPRLALLMQQEIPKEMLTKIANQMRSLKKETEDYVKNNSSKIVLLNESDYFNLSSVHFDKDCVHLNSEGHKLLASKLKDIF